MERRVIWAIVLMMVIAIAPTFFLEPPKKPVRATPAAVKPVDGDSGTAGGPDTAAGLPTAGLEAAPPREALQEPGEAGDSVVVSSPLYRYVISTRGAALVQASLLKYRTLGPDGRGDPVRLVPDAGRVHQLALSAGHDTVSLADWDFTPSSPSLEVEQTAELTLTASRGGVTVDISYRFDRDDYQIGVQGRVTGLGPAGGHLLIDMGDGMRQTEADSSGNWYEYGIVTKTTDSKLTKFSKIDPGETVTLGGPFEWAAIKSKYFVAALLTVDSGEAQVSGVVATARPDQKPVTRVATTFGLPVDGTGLFGYRLYVGPLEYPRLRAIGHDFYDVNPYGWPGFRTLIRPIAVGARWLLVWMHENLHMAYGMVLVAFGIMIRILLWPLNQKGMRASIRMQALQPEMQRLQEQYKSDPQRMQQEVMALYRREGVNPMGGCWPVLLPWPILLALFFVLANTIELRGQPFLWLPDLSLKDPLYIIPVLMGASMYGVSKVGMMGMPPTPQTKMMLYMMPVMMTVLFVNFASGLNLYYFIQNLVSIPQQWYLAKERMKAQVPAPPEPAKKSKKK